MKKICLSFFLLGIMLINMLTVSANFGIKLYIDNEEIQCENAPRIINGRTLVPARAVFEHLNSYVDWDDKTKTVTITDEKNKIVLVIGDKTAKVNGVKKTMEVPAMIFHGSTFIPVRFVSEELKYTVKWDDMSKTVYIVSPKNSNVSDVLSVDTSDMGNTTIVDINLSKPVTPDVFTLSEPTRVILDFPNTSISSSDGKTQVDNIYIKEVRWAIHEDYSRIVVEASRDIEYKIIGKGTKKVSVKVWEKGTDENASEEIPPVDNNDQDEQEQQEVEIIRIPRDKMIVALDAGHGGSDSGALGKDSMGNTLVDEFGKPILMEKNVNLYIAQKTRDYLESKGEKVVMTRDDDSFAGTNMENLVARAEVANRAGAVLFVSIHNNSATSPEATGTEICYTELSSGKYGITSKGLAKNIITPLVKATGLSNRGLVNRQNLVVLKYTAMPAVLIECGFLTCEKDQKVLMSNNKLDEIAVAIGDAIIKSFDQMAG